MGQSKSTPKERQILTPQILNQSIQSIFGHQEIKFESPFQIVKPLERILQHMEEFIPANQTSQGFLINLKMIKIMYHKKFLYCMSKLITLLMETLQQLMTKNTLMITREEWKFCLDLTNFIIFFSDDKIIRMVDSASIRTDIHYETKQTMAQLQKQGKVLQATQCLIDKFQIGQVQRIQKCLRISLQTMINLRLQVLTRSKPVLNLIRKLQQSCFILYLKAIYSNKHSHPILLRGKKQFLKTNLIIGHYFLGCGSDSCKSSVYESAVIFLYSLIQDNRQHLRQLKALPSHLFKNLPIISQNTIYDFIVNICLFSLCYIKDGSNIFTRMSFNRIMTIKLVQLIVKQLQITSPQITYYLQQLSIQTRAGQIERAFVNDLVDKYRSIIQQTVNLKQSKKGNKKGKQQQKDSKISRYSRQIGSSQILQKFTEAGKVDYNIKFSNKQIKISPIDVVTELQNDENTLQIEFRVLCQKYIYEVMLSKKMMFQYNDRQIWSEIIESILQNKSDEDIYSNDDGNSSENSPKFKIKMIRQQERQIKDQVYKNDESKSNKNNDKDNDYPDSEMKQSKIKIECEPEDLNDQNLSQQQEYVDKDDKQQQQKELQHGQEEHQQIQIKMAENIKEPASTQDNLVQ